MNRLQISLIDDPPPKNPYFTLPDPQFFITPEDLAREESYKTHHTSVNELFGVFDKMTDDQSAKFLLTLMQNSTFKADYSAMAKKIGMTNGYQVFRRFQAIAVKQGFEVEGDSLKSQDTAGGSISNTKGVSSSTAPDRDNNEGGNSSHSVTGYRPAAENLHMDSRG